MFECDDFSSWDQADQMAIMAFEMYENGEMSMALTQLQEAIEINPSNSSWFFNKGLTLDAMEQFEEAILAYNSALELSPDDPEILNSLAVDYTRLGQYDIPVYEIRPGIIKTDMTAGVVEKYDRLIAEGLCITRRWGLPGDVGQAAAAVACRKWPYATGQVVMVDGGLSVPRL